MRAEREQDQTAIADLQSRAFAVSRFGDQGEAAIVDALRAAGDLSISLVACDPEGALIGHVAVSPVRIAGAERWYGLGPIGVLPEHRGRGVGAALMEAAIAALRAAGASGCVLLGDPAWYRRFGFVEAAPLWLAGVPADHFLALDLHGARPAGEVHYSPAFG